MSEFVTRDEYIRMEQSVEKLVDKVDNLGDRMVRLECAIEGIPNKVLAQITEKLYNNDTRVSIVEKGCTEIKARVSKLEGNQGWIAKTVIGIVLASLIGIVYKTNF